MRATFLGFEIVKTGVQSAQMGLDITGKNIGNMNVEGYSRQVLEQSTIFYPTTSYKYAPLKDQRFGQGVSIDAIKQIRDKYLDIRFRTANSQKSDLAKKTEILESINNIIDETTNDGLGVHLEEFYARLQVLSSNTGKVEFSSLVRSAAQKLTETVNFYYNQLSTVRAQEIENLELVTIKNVNKYIEKIVELNTSIQNEVLLKNSPNDLYDARNLLLDKLSAELNISVTENEDGTVSVLCGDKYLIDAAGNNYAQLSFDSTSGKVFLDDGTELEMESGAIKGTLDLINGKGSFAASGENDFRGILYYLESLDNFAAKFAETFNTLNGPGKPLFTGTDAKSFGISEEWLADANYITATTDSDPTEGKNDNILRMLCALDSPVQITDNFEGSFSDFVLTLMSEAGIDKNYYADISKTADTVLTSIDNQRESIKGVLINEETVNMIKYQKAFEASARVMTAMDEMLDIIINRMGIVGR